MFEQVQKYNDWGLLVLRVLAAAVFLYAGIGKLTGIAGFTGMLGGMGFPAAAFLAWLVAIVETLGGLALLFGYQVRLATPFLAVVMLVAAIAMWSGRGFGSAYAPVFGLGLTVALFFLGAGRYALGARRPSADATAA